MHLKISTTSHKGLNRNQQSSRYSRDHRGMAVSRSQLSEHVVKLKL